MTDQKAGPPFIMAETSDKAICVSLNGPIKIENFEVARVLCKEMLEKQGDIRFLMLCDDDIAWSEETARQDLSFTMDYGGLISRIALVNPPPVMISLFKIKDALHSKRQVRYFGRDEFPVALQWVNEEA